MVWNESECADEGEVVGPTKYGVTMGYESLGMVREDEGWVRRVLGRKIRVLDLGKNGLVEMGGGGLDRVEEA
jgi:hypothetical protein